MFQEKPFYLYLKPSQSDYHFGGGNRPEDFRVDLRRYIRLSDKYEWECSLEHVTMEVAPTDTNNIVVCCSVCEFSHIYGREHPILRLIPFAKRPVITRSHFVPVRVREFDVLRIYSMRTSFDITPLLLSDLSIYFRPVIHKYKSRNIYSQGRRLER